MKILKRIGLVILGLVVLLLIAAVFIKKDYTVERDIAVNKSTEGTFS